MPTRDQLILSLRDQVNYFAWRICQRTGERGLVSMDDLRGAGWIGAIQAVDAWDPSRGVPLLAFSRPRIKGAVSDYLRSIDPLGRGARRSVKAGRTNDPFRERVPGTDLCARDHGFTDAVNRVDYALLLRAVPLSARHLAILREYYQDDIPMAEIGRIHGCNESRVCQMLGEIRRKMRDAILIQGRLG